MGEYFFLKPTICCEKKCVLKQTVKNFEEKLFLRSFKFEIHGCQQNLTIGITRKLDLSCKLQR